MRARRADVHVLLVIAYYATTGRPPATPLLRGSASVMLLRR